VRVEAEFDRFDLDSRVGLSGMLLAHGLALDALLPNLDALPGMRDEVARLRGFIDDALDAAGGEARVPVATQRIDAHPLGAVYVILGSRRGAAVLERRLVQSPAGWPMERLAYFTERLPQHAWRELIERLDLVQGAAEADQVVSGAFAAFDAFGTFARAVMDGQAAGRAAQLDQDGAIVT